MMKMTDEAWWQESPFVWVEEEMADEALEPPKVDPVDTLVDDLLPAIRFQGDIMETDLSPTGLTEWIPGVDPVSELIEESMLPPLPPAVTTLMRSYQRGEDMLPKGSGHVNIMIDLSGSMWSPAGEDSEGNEHNVASVAQALTRIMVNACRAGKHSFAVFTFGTSGGDGYSNPSSGRRLGSATRQIWGSTIAEATDYDGFIATMKLNPAMSRSGYGVGDWSSMSGNDTGYAAERVYRYMEYDVGSQLPDVSAATCFFITDAVWGDMWIAGGMKRQDGSWGSKWGKSYGRTPPQDEVANGVIDTEEIERLGDGDADGNGLWYWAKKYHDNFGPFVLFKINSPSQARSQDFSITDQYGRLVKNPDHEFTRQGKMYERVFREYVGGKKGYEKCVFQGLVKLDIDGGTLPAVAKSLVAFINDLGGGNVEPLCGGKGVTF